MFIGTKNKQLDWFDNPYIYVKVYETSEENESASQDSQIKLKKCEAQEI